ncbi:MAG: cysteine rich repeat-containing protein, partial [Methyloceanibacter sp.]
PPPVARAYRPRQKIFLLRTSCGGDVRALCPGVPLGGGRVIACLEAHAPSLSPNCQRRHGGLGALRNIAGDFPAMDGEWT